MAKRFDPELSLDEFRALADRAESDMGWVRLKNGPEKRPLSAWVEDLTHRIVAQHRRQFYTPPNQSSLPKAERLRLQVDSREELTVPDWKRMEWRKVDPEDWRVLIDQRGGFRGPRDALHTLELVDPFAPDARETSMYFWQLCEQMDTHDAILGQRHATALIRLGLTGGWPPSWLHRTCRRFTLVFPGTRWWLSQAYHAIPYIPRTGPLRLAFHYVDPRRKHRQEVSVGSGFYTRSGPFEHPFDRTTRLVRRMYGAEENDVAEADGIATSKGRKLPVGFR